jgi:putative heme iron utilization protein
MSPTPSIRTSGTAAGDPYYPAAVSKPRRHGEPRDTDTPRQEPLYDDSVATPSHAEQARTLLARAQMGVLSTHAAELDGHPYGSMVIYGLHEGDPILLISGLAEHTKNLEASPRCSLLVHDRGPDNPLALARATLVGEASKVVGDEREAVAASFLARHPDASYYADFTDFHYWRIRVSGVRYIGGFGRMSWVEPEPWQGAEADPLLPDAKRIIGHMNEDHADALRLYSEAFSRSGPVPEAVMTEVDRYGFEMSVTTDQGPRPVRIAFDEPVGDATEARKALVALVKRAREQLGQ